MTRSREKATEQPTTNNTSHKLSFSMNAKTARYTHTHVETRPRLLQNLNNDQPCFSRSTLCYAGLRVVTCSTGYE